MILSDHHRWMTRSIADCLIARCYRPPSYRWTKQRKVSKYLFLNKRWIGNLESSAWSGTLGRSSSWANDTSDKSRDELLKSQNDFKEVLGEARKRLGAVWSPGEGFSSQQGALVSSIAVHLGHLPLLGQVVLEWGIVHVRRSVQNKINRFLI